MARAWLTAVLLLAWQSPAFPATLRVPEAFPTIQSALAAAADGDLVLVAPGVYPENLTLSGKVLTLASHFHTTGDRALIGQTIIDGRSGSRVIYVDSSVGPGTTITGFTLRNADDGVNATGRFDFLDNRVTGTGDGIDYSRGGGLVRSCVIEDNSDDGIDLNNAVGVVIEKTAIQNNGDDGIEIRLQAYTGPQLEIALRDNVISGNDEDGIQLIGYNTLTARIFRIERNLFENNAMAAIGMMCCEDTEEDYQGASLRERVHLFHNTFIGNAYAVTGGDSLVALNNLFVNTAQVALRRVDGGSVAAHNLFFANGTDYSESNVDPATTFTGDPLLDARHRLSPGSPAIDVGTACYTFGGEVVLQLPPGSYCGPAPDLGAFERSPVAIPGHSRVGLALVTAVLAGLGAWGLGRRRLPNT